RQFAAGIAGIEVPQGGTIAIGGHDLAGLPASVRARQIAYAGPEPVLFPGTIRDNILFALRNRPRGGPGLAWDERRLEALRTGNPLETVDDLWIDYPALGLTDAADLDARLLGILGRLGMDDDLYRFGLTALSSVSHDTPVGARMIAARIHLQEHFVEAGMAGLVIPFARGRYNEQATIAENLLFGVPRDPALMGARLAGEPRFRAVLSGIGLLDDLAAMGVRIARNLVDIFHDLPPGHPLFRRFSLIAPDELRDFERRLAGIPADGRLSPDDEEAFLALALPYVEPRLRLGLLDDAFRARLLGARGLVQAALEGPDGHEVEVYDPARINPRSSILDNLLFGRIDTARMHGEAEVRKQVRAVVREFGLEAGIRRRGLDYEVGNRGRMLTPRQQAAVDLTRALARRPEILVVDGAAAQLADGVRTLFSAMDADAPGASLLAVVGEA
ncbi:ABC transporter ATP-binding protein, partial [Methylobacterium trifolii]